MTSLTKKTSVEAAEATDHSLANDSDWTLFKSKIEPNDEIWEYDSTSVLMGWASGEGGVALVRDDLVVAKIAFWACG